MTDMCFRYLVALEGGSDENPAAQGAGGEATQSKALGSIAQSTHQRTAAILFMVDVQKHLKGFFARCIYSSIVTALFLNYFWDIPNLAHIPSSTS